MKMAKSTVLSRLRSQIQVICLCSEKQPNISIKLLFIQHSSSNLFVFLPVSRVAWRSEKGINSLNVAA
jgi:hypothetical protein